MQVWSVQLQKEKVQEQLPQRDHHHQLGQVSPPLRTALLLSPELAQPLQTSPRPPPVQVHQKVLLLPVPVQVHKTAHHRQEREQGQAGQTALPWKVPVREYQITHLQERVLTPQITHLQEPVRLHQTTPHLLEPPPADQTDLLPEPPLPAVPQLAALEVPPSPPAPV
mmetsp:Transcript_13742/g.29531  ORF Transcript_13742/g.29531 Transcript_13742/m.29531 type:complete len:167 (-) Transcript_13742:947-1447(-)